MLDNYLKNNLPQICSEDFSKKVLNYYKSDSLWEGSKNSDEVLNSLFRILGNIIQSIDTIYATTIRKTDPLVEQGPVDGIIRLPQRKILQENNIKLTMNEYVSSQSRVNITHVQITSTKNIDISRILSNFSSNPRIFVAPKNLNFENTPTIAEFYRDKDRYFNGFYESVILEESIIVNENHMEFDYICHPYNVIPEYLDRVFKDIYNEDNKNKVNDLLQIKREAILL
jgi:ABC-type antimicrobial peptide transport system permease subunit